MAVAPAVPDVTDAPASEPARRSWVWLRDAGFAVLSLAMAYWITSGIWVDPFRRAVSYNEGDHAFFEWVLGYGVQIWTHGDNPFWTTLINAPAGVNLAANTSVTVYALVFAPLTYVAGPPVTYVTILTLNLAGSSFAWYAFLRRFVVRRRSAAAIGALFCGFAPGWIAHANGHLNWTAGWLIPVLLWWVLRLGSSRRWVLNGVVLGLLITVAFSIAPELLFSVAIAATVFVITWCCSRATWPQARAAAPRALAALGITVLLSGALLAYPLYMHFAGPGSYQGTGFDQRRYVEDVAGYGVYPFRSIAGAFGFQRGDLASNQTEGASFFGVPLLLLVIAGTVLLWWRADRSRKVLMRSLTIVGLLFAVLSFGPRLNWFTKEYNVPLPYAALAHLPIFDSALPARLALLVVCVIGVTLALLADRSFFRGPLARRIAWGAAFAAALVPIFPTPVLTSDRTTEPQFIADGTWKLYVRDGQVMSALPYAASAAPDAQRWQAYTLARGGPQFRIPDGYFLGPGGPDGTGRVGAPPRRTDWMLLRPALTGYVDDIDNFDRARVREDMAYWQVDALFIPDEIIGRDGLMFRASLVSTVTALFGPGERVQDVLIWRVRPGLDPVSVPGDGADTYGP